MIQSITDIISKSSTSDTFVECRRCGTTLHGDATECTACGSVDVAHYHLEE